MRFIPAVSAVQIRSPLPYSLRPHGQAVKTSPFHGGNPDKGEPGEKGKDGKDANLTFTDNGKTYTWNLSVVDSKLRFSYEEV